ncbi:MAG: hypothetical protein IID05_10345 [Gemmatimonadetes bacterium]|nr:hypothetical protein [Gemmatimonadota bacterium]
MGDDDPDIQTEAWRALAAAWDEPTVPRLLEALGDMDPDIQSGARRAVTDSVEGAVEKLNQRLDDEEEDRVAILSAPANLGRVAVLRYVTEQILSSAPENVQELRERGFLP